MSLEPIQLMRYDTQPRLDVNDFVTPIYRYEGYVRNEVLPRGSDARHQVLESRRQMQKVAETNRLILDRPFQ